MPRVPLLTLFCSFALLAPSCVHANEPDITFYEISGNSANSLRKQMNEKRPQEANGERFDALTRNRIVYTYRYGPTANGCKFTEFSTQLETKITMPRWVDADPMSKLGQKWQIYYQALYRHELGHRDIALNSLKELEEAGRNFESSNKCDSIAEAFKLIYSSILQKYKLQNLKYDQETDHGKKNGATFP